MRCTWEDFITPNSYGECVTTDVKEIVYRMKQYIERRGAELELDQCILVNHILTYLLLRQTASVHEISNPHIVPSKPEGWTVADEYMWIDWIHTVCPVNSWLEEVVEPVLGTIPRLWECEGWRSELVEYLPWWMRRSISIVNKFDPTYNPDECLENDIEDGAKKKEIDPYLLDHGSSKQKRRK